MECFAGLAAFDFYQSIRKTIVTGHVRLQCCMVGRLVVVFPNSVYMVTDFIHISNHGFMRLVDTAQGYRAYE